MDHTCPRVMHPFYSRRDTHASRIRPAFTGELFWMPSPDYRHGLAHGAVVAIKSSFNLRLYTLLEGCSAALRIIPRVTLASLARLRRTLGRLTFLFAIGGEDGNQIHPSCSPDKSFSPATQSPQLFDRINRQGKPVDFRTENPFVCFGCSYGTLRLDIF